MQRGQQSGLLARGRTVIGRHVASRRLAKPSFSGGAAALRSAPASLIHELPAAGSVVCGTPSPAAATAAASFPAGPTRLQQQQLLASLAAQHAVELNEAGSSSSAGGALAALQHAAAHSNQELPAGLTAASSSHSSNGASSEAGAAQTWKHSRPGHDSKKTQQQQQEGDGDPQPVLSHVQTVEPAAAAEQQQPEQLQLNLLPPQQQQQQEQQAVAASTPVTRRLRKQCSELLSAGQADRADGLLWGAIMRLTSLQQLQSSTDTLAAAGLLRPAVLVALLVQLGKLAGRQQRQQQQQQQRQRREAQAAAAVDRNRKKQQQKKHREKQQQQQDQQLHHPQHHLQQQGLQATAVALQQHSQQQHHHPQLRQQWQQQAHLQLKPLQVADRPQQQQPAPTTNTRVSSSSSTSNNIPAAQGSFLQQQQQQQQPLPPPLQQLQQQQAGAPAVPAASSSSSPLYAHRYQQYLLKRIVGLIKAVPPASFNTLQLSLLPHWLVQLRVRDQQLLHDLAAAAAVRLEEEQPGRLVPVLWGLAKTSSAAAEAMPAGQQQQQPAVQAQRRQQHLLRRLQQQQQGRLPQALASAAGPASIHPQLPRQQAQQQQPAVAGQQPSAEFVSSWLQASGAHLGSFSPSDLAASLYSLALLGQQPPAAWVEAFFAASAAALTRCTAQDLSNMLWAMATLQLQPPAGAAAAATAGAAAAPGAAPSPWWLQFQAAAAGQLWHFNGIGIANLLWAAAKLNLQPSPQLSELLLWQAQRTFWGMDSQLLVSTAWAVAGLRLQPRRFWLHRLCNRAAVLYGSMTPGLAASLLLSLGALRHCPRAWLARFLTALQPQLPAFSPQDFANTFTAFARMLYSPPQEWMFDFTVEARLALPRCNAAAALSILHAQAILSTNTSFRVNPDFLAALLGRLRTLAGSSSSVKDGGFSASDCGNCAQSLVHLKVAPGVALLAALAGRFSEQAAAGLAGPAEVATFTWALGAFWRGSAECMWLRQQPALMGQLVGLSGQLLGSYGPMELRRVVVGLASMGCNPGPAWLQAHEAAVVSQLGSLYAGSLEHVLRAYRELSYTPQQQEQLAAALQQKKQQHAAQQHAAQQQQKAAELALDRAAEYPA